MRQSLSPVECELRIGECKNTHVTGQSCREEYQRLSMKRPKFVNLLRPCATHSGWWSWVLLSDEAKFGGRYILKATGSSAISMSRMSSRIDGSDLAMLAEITSLLSDDEITFRFSLLSACPK
jgi:hypothetical protein